MVRYTTDITSNIRTHPNQSHCNHSATVTGDKLIVLVLRLRYCKIQIKQSLDRFEVILTRNYRLSHLGNMGASSNMQVFPVHDRT